MPEPLDQMSLAAVSRMSQSVARDVEQMPPKYDGQPFSGEVVGAQLGQMQAMIYILSKCIITLTNEIETIKRVLHQKDLL